MGMAIDLKAEPTLSDKLGDLLAQHGPAHVIDALQDRIETRANERIAECNRAAGNPGERRFALAQAHKLTILQDKLLDALGACDGLVN